MKLFADEQYNKLEQSLKQTFHERPVPELSIRWRQNVMLAVRRIGKFTNAFNPVMFVQRFAWRFVMAACLMVLVLTGYLWYFDLSPFRDMNDVLLEDSAQVIALRQTYQDF